MIDRTPRLTRDDLIGATIVASLLAIGWLLGLGPLLRAHAAERSQVEALEAKRAAVETATADADHAESTAAALASELAAIRIDAPASESLNQFIERLLGLTDARGLTVDRLVPGTPSTTDAWTDTPIDLEGRCEAAAFPAFMAALRAEAPSARIERFSAAVASGNTLDVRLGCVWRTAAVTLRESP